MRKCMHLYFKTEHLEKACIGGLCRRRWDVGIKCYKKGLEHICKGYEVEPEKSEAQATPVPEDHIESVPEVQPRPVETGTTEPVKETVKPREAKRGRPKRHVWGRS